MLPAYFQDGVLSNTQDGHVNIAVQVYGDIPIYDNRITEDRDSVWIKEYPDGWRDIRVSGVSG